MKADLNTSASSYTVVAEEADVENITRSWVVGATVYDRLVEFDFSTRNGDLLDYRVFSTEAEGAPIELDIHDDHAVGIEGDILLALSDEACRAGADSLELNDVLAIRFGISPALR